MRYQRRHNRDRPRGWFSLFFRLGGWLCLIFGTLLVVMTLFSASALFLADKMDREGKFARGVVSDKRIAVHVDDDGDERREFFVTFTYKTSEGGRETEAKVPEPLHNRLDLGDEHMLRYLRSDPGRIEYELDQYRRDGNVLRNVGLGFGIAGLLALWIYGQRANRAIKARRDGQKRYAVITEIRDSNVQVNGRAQGRLVWREEDGLTGQSLIRGMQELRDMYEAGDRIVVFRRGRHAFWEGDVGPPAREVEG